MLVMLRRAEGRGAGRVFRSAVVALAVWSLLAWGCAQALIVRAELAHADALAVLAGSDAYIERTQRAAQLFKAGYAPKILLTDDNLRGGWSEEHWRNLYFIERAVNELRRAGVPAEKIEILPGAVSSTYDEAVRLREYAAAHRLRSILVVTSAYHSRRALWTLRHVFQGSEVQVGLDPATPGQQTPWPATWWFQPRGWRIVALEYPKLVYYWLRYR